MLRIGFRHDRRRDNIFHTSPFLKKIARVFDDGQPLPMVRLPGNITGKAGSVCR